MKSKKIVSCILAVLILSGCSAKPKDNHENTPNSNQQVSQDPSTNTNTGELEMNIPDLTSLDSITLIVNKQHGLPSDYVPSNLVKPDVPLTKSSIMLQEVAADAMKEMFDAAKEDGVKLMIGSGYRSYDYQTTLYNNYVQRDGQKAADRYSAKPGLSEHQTGLAADLSSGDGECYLKGCFKDTKEGQWLAENAWEYGFILRYPEEKEEITGYIFEPWHYRYFGLEQAKLIFDSGLTVEEYYQLLD